MHFRRWTFAVLAAAALCGGIAVGVPQAAEPIRIGTFLSVTGPASFLGDPQLATFKMYVEEINKAGGIIGRPVELIHYDVGVDSAKARTAAKRLIKNDRVDAILGGSSTGTTMAAANLVEKAEVPFISLAAAVVITEPVKHWIFKMAHADRMACAKIFEDLKARGLTKLGLISGTGGFGKSMHEQCLALAPEYGIAVIADETYGPKDTDMTPQLTKIRNTEGLQVVLNARFRPGSGGGDQELPPVGNSGAAVPIPRCGVEAVYRIGR